MNTAFALMACYKSALIPLEIVGTEYLGLGKREVNEQAARNRLPFPAIRLSDSSPVMRVEELANWIDHQAAAAQLAAESSNININIYLFTSQA